MKSLLTAIALISSAVTFGQDVEFRSVPLTHAGDQNYNPEKKPVNNIQVTGYVKGKGFPAAGSNNFLWHSDSSFATQSHQIYIGSKKRPVAAINPKKYTLVLNGEVQTSRESDTLTIHDKAIRFVVIDGVLYEVLRSTGVKKVEVNGFIFRSGTYPPGITLTPGYQIFPGPNFKAN